MNLHWLLRRGIHVANAQSGPQSGVTCSCCAAAEKLSFLRIARERSGLPKMRMRRRGPAATQFKFAQRCFIEWIARQAFGVVHGAQRFIAPFSAVALRNGNGAIERDDRRRVQRKQRIIKRDDCFQSVLSAFVELACTDTIAAST